jgi:VanZ family protein
MLSGRFKRHPGLMTVILCMLLSLTIELLQAWIPTRVSSLMDLILNTLGAGIGIGLWSLAGVRSLFSGFPKT